MNNPGAVFQLLSYYYLFVPSASSTGMTLHPIEVLLACGAEVAVVCFGNPSGTSMKLPADFWGTSGVNLPAHMLLDIEGELNW